VDFPEDDQNFFQGRPTVVKFHFSNPETKGKKYFSAEKLIAHLKIKVEPWPP